MGGNALRTSHNPPAPELLDLADRMGFVVMVEAFDCWKRGKTPAITAGSSTSGTPRTCRRWSAASGTIPA